MYFILRDKWISSESRALDLLFSIVIFNRWTSIWLFTCKDTFKSRHKDKDKNKMQICTGKADFRSLVFCISFDFCALSQPQTRPNSFSAHFSLDQRFFFSFLSLPALCSLCWPNDPRGGSSLLKTAFPPKNAKSSLTLV